MPLSLTMSLLLPIIPLVAMDTTSMVQATLTPTGAPRVFTRGRQITIATTVTTTKGRPMPLSPTMSLLLPIIPLVAMDTTSMVQATLTPTGAPRVCTRGRQITIVTTVTTTRGRPKPQSLTMSLPLPTTPLVAMDTTSMVQAILTPIGAPKVFTRGKPLATATSMWTDMTAMDTTARTPSMVSRLMATMPTSMRTARCTEALLGHAKKYENVPVVIKCTLLCKVTPHVIH